MKKIILGFIPIALAVTVWVVSSGTGTPKPDLAVESVSRTVQPLPATAAVVAPADARKSGATTSISRAARPAEDVRKVDASAGREPAGSDSQYAGKLLTGTVMSTDALIRQQEGKIAEKDRAELQKAESVTVLQPPAGRKILAFKDLTSSNCALLSQFPKPLTLSVTADGGVESAEFLRKSADPVPPSSTTAASPRSASSRARPS